MQCVYNPEVGRERQWGAGTLTPVATRRRRSSSAPGPSGLEYARVAAARGHEIVVLEREDEVGGHVRWLLACSPAGRSTAQIARWLRSTGRGERRRDPHRRGVSTDDLDALLAAERPDHVVVATGASYRRDGWQGQTAQPLPGWETGNCVTWDEVATGAVSRPAPSSCSTICRTQRPRSPR